MSKYLNLENFNFGKNKYAVASGVVLAVIALVALMLYGSRAYATEDYWDIKVKDKVIATVNSQSDANKVIDGVKNHYAAKGAKVESVKIDPEITLKQRNVREKDAPKTAEVKDVVNLILTGNVETRTYTVEEGDSVWDIAMKNGYTYEEFVKMNSDKDLAFILPGDELNLTEAKPYVTVELRQTVTSTEAISPEDQFEETEELYEGEEEVKEYGTAGEREVIVKQTLVNGAAENTEVLKEKVVKEATPNIVLKGTKKRPSGVKTTSGTSSRSFAGAASYSGNGSSVVSFAKQFVGNPYVLGGRSLTNGCDCYGFVWAVYQQFGINIGISAGNGVSVPVSQMQPGDIIIYSGHYSMYAGGGQEVHALNPSDGIKVTPLGWTNAGAIVDVRRFV